MNRARLRWLAKWAGRAIAVAAVVFVVIALREQWREISARSLAPTVWLTVIGFGVAYGTAMMLNASAWHRLICDFARMPLPRRQTLASYATSQPAKYVPGNVFQYVSRHGWMIRAGVANTPLLKAMVWDIFLLLLAASLIAILGFLIFPIPVVFLSEALLRNLALAAAVVFVAGAVILAMSPNLQRWFGESRPRVTTIFAVVPLLMLFFVVQAVIFTGLGSIVTGEVVPQLATVAVLAWLVGVVPMGTPGGLGTREAMILLCAGPLIGQSDALLLAGLFRLVTIIGDITCAFIGWAILRLPKPLDPETESN
jgi:glycosyltransferase 2 family protein